jgi:cytochrome c peroxidase
MKALTWFFFFLLLLSCRKEKVYTDDYTASPYILHVPAGFPQPVIPEYNQLTVEGVELGHRLYYDNILSSNGLSCSSCHRADQSFSTPLFHAQNGAVKSVPPHVNLAWDLSYNWNGSEPWLDYLCLGDFEPEFFNTNKDSLYARLIRHADYPKMFYRAFGISDISSLSYQDLKLKIVFAISQFMRTMISDQSAFDKYRRLEQMLSPAQYRGYILFSTEKGDCFHCHGSPLMTDNLYHNTGLDSIPSGFNAGRYNVTGNVHDMGKFSTPTLRNVELTAPYMHDGRFATLEEVIEFYNSGVYQGSPNIDPIMTKPGKETGLHLTDAEKADLVEFLKSLTDTAFIHNSAFGNPF